MTRLLLVEDDEVIRVAVGRTLERYGFAVVTAGDGLAGLERFREGVPDLLLLDVMLPGLDGIGLCRRVRETSQVPILTMSARGDSLDVVAGLEAGADDYVVKPVDTSVLVARIRAVMRRAAVDTSEEAHAELVFGDVRIDTGGMEVTRAGEPVALTPTELRLLLELAAHSGVVGISLPWPSQGQATVDVEGIGSLGVKGEQKPVPIASVTKVMTALVVLKDHPLPGDDQGPMIRVDAPAAAEASDTRQSTVFVETGQAFSERALLEMMLIPSGNNIARLLARWDAGSERAFATKMNDAARSLGMTATVYTGASGYEDSTSSTAVDQLKLAEKIVADDAFARIVAMPTATVPGLRDTLVNTNTLLGEDGVIGMKTGSSTPAGGALMWAAREPDAAGRTRLVLGVVLDQHQGSSSNDDLRAALASSRVLVHGVAGALASMR